MCCCFVENEQAQCAVCCEKAYKLARLFLYLEIFMELNPLFSQLDDIAERTQILRGYL